jgi:hypothetical protein
MSCLNAGNSVLVAGVRDEHQKIVFPPVDIVEIPLVPPRPGPETRRGVTGGIFCSKNARPGSFSSIPALPVEKNAMELQRSRMSPTGGYNLEDDNYIDVVLATVIAHTTWGWIRSGSC